MLYAGLDLSRKRLDFHLLDEAGETVEVGAAPPDADGLRGLAARVARFGEPILAAIESMNGARFVHDQLEQRGWQVEIADALKIRDSRRWPVRPTGSTPGCWPNSRAASLSPRSGCPTARCGPSASGPASGSVESSRSWFTTLELRGEGVKIHGLH